MTGEPASQKQLLFLTGTRADFGKLKPLIQAVDASPEFDYSLFVTGMHVLKDYGYTAIEVEKSGFKTPYTYMNQTRGEPMDMVLANTVAGLARYTEENRPDMLIVHGDRVEALAGAAVGALRNILVAHIEGGEVTGTVDELIRHAVTKLSHLHFVANETAAARLRQLGEAPSSIYVIGSPEIDVMLSEELPTLEEAKAHYGIDFANYAIAAFHPVTTQSRAQQWHDAQEFATALLRSSQDYVVIMPNNDTGSDAIRNAYGLIQEHPRFQFFPSLRFEYFLVLLKHALFIVGNSSAGVREGPVYGVPVVNVGTRQHRRFCCESVMDCPCEDEAIRARIAQALARGRFAPTNHFGDGRAVERFVEALVSEALWHTPRQKLFHDAPELPMLHEFHRVAESGGGADA